MMEPLTIQFAVLVGLLVCSAFFSCSETALFSLNPMQIHRIAMTHPRAAERIQRMLSAPTQLLSTILIGNTLVNVIAAGVGYAIAERFSPGHGEMIAIPVMTILLLIFGEVTPKRLAMSRPEKLAIAFSRILPVLNRTMTPLRILLERIVGLLGQNLHAPNRTLTEDELLSVVEAGEAEGILDEQERSMVDGIVGLEDVRASEVMTPRVDVIGIDLDDPPAEWEKTALRVQYRYLPIYRRSLDRPEGFLDVTRYLLSENRALEASVLEPFYVPETARLDTILATFQKEHRRVAFVTDEYGGTAGLVTLGDILEEIVGDVQNEYGVEKLTIEPMSENRWIVDGSTSLEDVNYELDVKLHARGVDRIGGWINARIGRIPHTAEVVEAQGCRVTVHRVRKNRVATVILEKLPEPPNPTGKT